MRRLHPLSRSSVTTYHDGNTAIEAPGRLESSRFGEGTRQLYIQSKGGEVRVGRRKIIFFTIKI
jgi:hypothetical protein